MAFKSSEAPSLSSKAIKPMLESMFSNSSFKIAEDALNGLAARQTAISDNIANVNTPGYKREEVPFEQQLASAINESYNPYTGVKETHVSSFTPNTIQDTSSSLRLDGNNVDIDREMVMLAENTLRYETMSEYMSYYFTNLKTSINVT